jgi:hypothetical protein
MGWAPAPPADDIHAAPGGGRMLPWASSPCAAGTYAAGCCSHGAGGAQGLAARDNPSPSEHADMPPTGLADADARPPWSATASMGLGRCGWVMPSLLTPMPGVPILGGCIHGNIGPAAAAAAAETAAGTCDEESKLRN